MTEVKQYLESWYKMKLYLVEDYARWGYSYNVVRAKSPEEAVKLTSPGANIYDDRIKVVELDPHGKAAVLWCHDESPDSDW